MAEAATACGGQSGSRARGGKAGAALEWRRGGAAPRLIDLIGGGGHLLRERAPRRRGGIGAGHAALAGHATRRQQAGRRLTQVRDERPRRVAGEKRLAGRVLNLRVAIVVGKA